MGEIMIVLVKRPTDGVDLLPTKVRELIYGTGIGDPAMPWDHFPRRDGSRSSAAIPWQTTSLCEAVVPPFRLDLPDQCLLWANSEALVAWTET